MSLSVCYSTHNFNLWLCVMADRRELSVNAFFGPTKLQGLLFMCQIVNSINVIKGGASLRGKGICSPVK